MVWLLKTSSFSTGLKFHHCIWWNFNGLHRKKKNTQMYGFQSQTSVFPCYLKSLSDIHISSEAFLWEISLFWCQSREARDNWTLTCSASSERLGSPQWLTFTWFQTFMNSSTDKPGNTSRSVACGLAPDNALCCLSCWPKPEATVLSEKGWLPGVQ